MTSQQLREVHQTRPFRPFWLNMADGTRVRVSHPELMMVTPTGRTVTVATRSVVKIIDVMLVTAIEIEGERPRQRRRA